jgi:hypothetical protein
MKRCGTDLDSGQFLVAYLDPGGKGSNSNSIRKTTGMT